MPLGCCRGGMNSPRPTASADPSALLRQILVLIKEDVLAAYPALAAFYARFAALEPTQKILADGGEMPGQLSKYF